MTSDTRVTAYEVNWKAAARALAQDNKRLRAVLTEIAALPDSDTSRGSDNSYWEGLEKAAAIAKEVLG
jgi:hypothetical protein